MEKLTSVSEHYAELTDRMLKFGGDLLATHYGLWGPETKTDQEGLLRANKTLVDGCDLGVGKRVLDAGCGIGGTAITLAENYGITVTGLTNCEPHIEVAQEQAKKRGVDHLVDFHYGDFMNMPFAEASFDFVLNHESFCYAHDKLAYLQGVFRVLRPGGRWQALEGLLSGEPMSEAQEQMHTAAQMGWRMPPLENWRDVIADLGKAGFVDIYNRDVSTEAAVSTERIHQGWLLFSFLAPNSNVPNQASKEFMDASINYDQGLREGVFSYQLVSGMRPLK